MTCRSVTTHFRPLRVLANLDKPDARVCCLRPFVVIKNLQLDRVQPMPLKRLHPSSTASPQSRIPDSSTAIRRSGSGNSNCAGADIDFSQAGCADQLDRLRDHGSRRSSRGPCLARSRCRNRRATGPASVAGDHGEAGGRYRDPHTSVETPGDSRPCACVAAPMRLPGQSHPFREGQHCRRPMDVALESAGGDSTTVVTLSRRLDSRRGLPACESGPCRSVIKAPGRAGATVRYHYDHRLPAIDSARRTCHVHCRVHGLDGRRVRRGTCAANELLPSERERAGNNAVSDLPRVLGTGRAG